MHLFVNALAASAGGGLTYLRNVIPELSRRPGIEVTVALTSRGRAEFQNFSNVHWRQLELSAPRRFWYEQFALPQLIRGCGANVLLSAGNFAVRHSPVPQILLSRNSLYTSQDFDRDLRERSEYRTWLDTRLRGWFARRSIAWANVTVVPSEAFAAELQRWTPEGRIVAIHHGFDGEAFTSDRSALDPRVQEKLSACDEALKLLFVSHYNYYRNFETLIRALSMIRKRMHPRPVRLLLTCNLEAGANPGTYRPEAAARLVRDNRVTDMVVELGTIPYGQLHQIYRRANLYVTPAYAETFAHPLVEAMSSGLPVIASDLPVHREICGDAGIYFQRFSPEELAACVADVLASPELANRLTGAGLARFTKFSWRKHVDELLELARSMPDR